MNDWKTRSTVALADADWQRWKPTTGARRPEVGQVLCEPGRAQRYAYFPTSAIISLVCILSNGAQTEIAVVGNEGIVDTSVFLGSTSTTGHGSVLIAGQVLPIGAQMIRDEFERDPIR